MTTTIASTEKLAVLGGTPVLENPPNFVWPPIDEATGKALHEMYLSGKWSWNGIWESRSAQKLAEVHGAKHAMLMVNGTVTLEAALHALGVGPGDEVIVPALTWLATAMAVIYVGAKPVLVDVEPDTLCLDPDLVEAAITPRTKAIIPVHLYGSMADMDRIMAIARKHDLKVLEDCAHAQGGQWKGAGLGSIGDIGSFSFQQSKAVSAGEGGAVITNDDGLQEKLHQCKHIGYGPDALQGNAAQPPIPGLICHNYRATEFQGVVLYQQLVNLVALIEKRNRNADFLTENLERIPGLKVQKRGRLATPGRQSYYSYIVLFDPEHWGQATRDQIVTALNKEGIFCGKTYGTVYRHLLWNSPQDSYRIHGDYQDQFGPSCQFSEEIGTARAISLFHCTLDLPQNELLKWVEVFAKVQKNAGLLAKLR